MNKPEIIVYSCLCIFLISLFTTNNDKIQTTFQLSSMAISGYFGFIKENKD